MKTLGFLGTGTITRAIIEGLNAKGGYIGKIIVSPRSESISAQLAKRFDCVKIAPDNQCVVDASDIVFLAVRPQIAQTIISELKFRANQEIVSFLAATPHSSVQSWIDAPAKITQAIPLPFVADCLGATVICPPNDTIAAIFDGLGAVIQVKDESSLNLFFAGSALMGTYFGVLETASRWLQGEGLSETEASTYLRQLYAGLNKVMMDGGDFASERQSHSTKGGLNEQLYRVFSENGGGTALEKGLSSVLQRLSAK